jgi:putative Mn2+ efflux pump MntP
MLIGQHLSTIIANYASYVGGSILLLFGLFMIYKSFQSSKKEESYLTKESGETGLISLSAGLSLDNLIVGFSFGLQNLYPLTTSSVIVVSSVLFTILGLNTGKYLKHHFRK